jgi:hypothetical protein
MTGISVLFSSLLSRANRSQDAAEATPSSGPFGPLFPRLFLVCAAFAVLLITPQIRAETPAPAATPHAQPQPTAASLDDYRKHLVALESVVDACAKARDKKTCDPALVGPDDRIPLGAGDNAERRVIGYNWLRILVFQAQQPDEAEAKPSKSQANAKTAPTPPSAQTKPPAARPNPPGVQPAAAPPRRVPDRTTSQLLGDAKTRLLRDLAQIDAAPPAQDPHAAQRDAMKNVLAGREYSGLAQTSKRDATLEKIGKFLNDFFEAAGKLKARSAWVGRVIVAAFVLLVCAGLVWGLLQLERRWRIRLTPELGGPAPGAASARDWQLWLEDARKAAAAAHWREAIHFVYWASISRLESRRLWPADRARTPREYLALVAPDDPRRPGLATLTGSFERTWYGGRPAGESDYRSAEQVASALVSGSSPTGGAAQ